MARGKPRVGRTASGDAATGGVSRRAILASAAGMVAAATLPRGTRSLPAAKPSVVVVGAGAFGGWTALTLLRRGARVTLVDAWGPGNSRASSGGETRVIRGVYGKSRIYTEMALRAFELWRENEARWKKTLYTRTGALWMISGEGEYVVTAIPHLRELGFAFERLSIAEARRRYPQVDFAGLDWCFLEREAGYLLARRACAAVLEAFQEGGGTYVQSKAAPGEIAGGRLDSVVASDGAKLSADHYVFACGPWLPGLFPEVIGRRIEPTRQEVFYFGTPAGDARFSEGRLPVWVEVPRFFYGIPGNEWRGFKIADDAHGPSFDPTSGDRVASPEALRSAREYVARRFPALARAPLLESRVCQYENSPDGDFLIDRHPGAGNLWLVGGGSGHGFKHGPAVGELVASNVLGEKPVEPTFSLARFQK